MKSILDCNGLHSLENKRLEQGELPSAEEEQIVLHRRQCEGCAVEGAIYDLLADQEISPAPFLGELDHRRQVSRILDAFDEEVRRGSRGTAGVESKKAWYISAAIAAAAVLVGVLLGVGIGDPGNAPVSKKVVSAPFGGASVLMSPGGAALQVGAPVSVGQAISSDDGRMALALPTGIGVILSPGTDVQLRRMDESHIDLFLRRGEITASVHPRQAGPRFSVITDHGTMRVTGTVFSVRADADNASVAVMRGSVEVLREKSVPVGVQASSASEGPDWGIFAVDEAQQRHISDNLEVLDILSKEDGVVLDLGTRPAGASVFVDGKMLGTTPMNASVRKGYRMLRIEKEGFQIVSEQLDAHGPGRLERMYVLADVGDLSIDTELTGKQDTELQEEKSPGRRIVVPSAEELLSMAQEYRIKGQWKMAARSYERLIAAYPGRGESTAALVSLGKLELNKLGSPRSALKRFNLYLGKGKGALYQEALYGKAEALKALGRKAEEKKALELFVHRYPDAVETSAALARLNQL